MNRQAGISAGKQLTMNVVTTEKHCRNKRRRKNKACWQRHENTKGQEDGQETAEENSEIEIQVSAPGTHEKGHRFSNSCGGKKEPRSLEIAKATTWQNHSIRGFISGTITKKMGLTVESTKNEAGERTYRLG